jgi:hypothetical protein
MALSTLACPKLAEHDKATAKKQVIVFPNRMFESSDKEG